MHRHALERHQETLRWLRERLAGVPDIVPDIGGSTQADVLAGCVTILAGIVADLVRDQIVAGEPAHAVAERFTRPGVVEGDRPEFGMLAPGESDPRD